MKCYEEDLFLLLLVSTTVVAQSDDELFDKFTQFCDELKTAEENCDVDKINSLLEQYPNFQNKSIKSYAKHLNMCNMYLAYLYQIGLSYIIENPNIKFGESTDIENIVVKEDNAPKGIYNLHGQKLDRLPASGIVIVDGRKYLIK